MVKKANNIKELAEKLKLSPTTVSRVLNGKSKTFRISSVTSQKVFDGAREYNYSPNRIARGLKLEKTETLGLIIPDIANPYFGSIAKTIEVEAHKRGYSIILGDSLEEVSTEAELLKLLTGRKADGIIIAPAGKKSRHIVEAEQQGIPLVVIDRFLPDTNLPYITTNNYAGALMAMEHLIEMGHRNIACIQGINGISANTDRVQGYCDALRKKGIAINDHYILGNDFGELNGYNQTRKILKMHHPPTAIFALSNLISLGILRALKEEGLKVPDDMSLVSFDEQPYSPFLACPMTTVEQPRNEIGKEAFELLLQIINDKNQENIISKKLMPKLIIRDSVKKFSISN
ncbi:MAG: LacI family DNA-binding transcriptional regulator [Mariniphaga sp.]